MEQALYAANWTKALTEIATVLRLEEKVAEQMLSDACEREEARCTRCGGRNLYKLNAGRARSGTRMRCSSCKYSFRQHTGRWLGRHRLPARVWLAAIKCFELGLGHLELAQVADLSPATADDLLATIQMSIAAQDPMWRKAAIAAATKGEPPKSFAVRQSAKGVRVDVLDEKEPGVRFPIAPGGQLAPAMKLFRLAARRWMNMDPARFALKLKELEVRSHGTSLFELAIDALVDYMPAEVRGDEKPQRAGRAPKAPAKTSRELVAA